MKQWRRDRIVLGLGFLVFTVMFGCQGNGARTDGEGSQSLVGPLWMLLEIEGKPLIEQSAITIEFAEDGQVSGSAGINRYFGLAARDEARELIFSQMGSTRMAGPPELMAQESTYLRLLQEVTSYDFAEGELQLRRGGSVVLRYRAAQRAAE